jgi:polyglutamine-binding protein 1
LRFWGPGHPEPSKEYLEVHYRLMATYGPLPDGWKEMYDPGTGRYFFWCTRTDKVDWFPPGHPKCNLLEPAARVREGIIVSFVFQLAFDSI